MRILIGIVLAAGEGRRLRPLTETRPKALIPVAGKPVIYYPLDLLARLGIKEVYVVVSYMKELVVKSVKSIANELSIDVKFVDQENTLGTGHAVKKVADKVLDDAVIIYGDLYINPVSVSNSMKLSIEKKVNTLVGVRVSNISKYGKLVVEGDKVLGIAEKPAEGGEGLANAGIYFVRSNILELVNDLKTSPRGEYELTDIVSIARDRGEEFKYIMIDSSDWQDIGYPWDLLKANRLALEKLSEKKVLGDVSAHSTIKGYVYIGEGATIKGCTYIEGPAYIGDEATIGPNAYIRPYTTILNKSHIGFSTEVKESIVMEGTHAAHLTYIGDSIIAENVNLGAGTKLANLRFDEKTVKMIIEGTAIDSERRKLGAVIGGHVKTGINVSIMPGVKIGSYSIIYPGVTVYRDVPPKTVVRKDWI
ncbi:MAG: sugar phosphate nucleotidyltransferase [Ignisphaera sp.]